MTDQWNGVTGNYIEDPTAIDGKRWIATAHGWQKVRNMLKDRVQWTCENCGAAAYFGDAHHIYGRGGGKREDRLEVNGVKFLRYLCRNCHAEAKILPWGGWRG